MRVIFSEGFSLVIAEVTIRAPWLLKQVENDTPEVVSVVVLSDVVGCLALITVSEYRGSGGRVAESLPIAAADQRKAPSY